MRFTLLFGRPGTLLEILANQILYQHWRHIVSDPQKELLISNWAIAQMPSLPTPFPHTYNGHVPTTLLKLKDDITKACHSKMHCQFTFTYIYNVTFTCIKIYRTGSRRRKMLTTPKSGKNSGFFKPSFFMNLKFCITSLSWICLFGWLTGLESWVPWNVDLCSLVGGTLEPKLERECCIIFPPLKISGLRKFGKF